MSNPVDEKRFCMVRERHRGTFERALEAGKVDERFIPFCKWIAENRDYFTSSCCSGRILLLAVPDSGSKKDAYFHRAWHRAISPEELKEGLDSASVEGGELWFKMEGFILHIGCKNLKNAEKIMELKAKAGIKRGGIIVAKPGKFIVELVSSQGIALPIKRGGKVLVGDDYLGDLLERANEKLGKNYGFLDRLEKVAKEVL